MQTQLDVLYRDQSLVVINKPSGLLVHRSMIDRHETRFAVQLLRDQLQQRVYPAHRLDKPTSGVLLFALNPDMARELSEQFRHHQIDKRYLIVVRGWTADHGEIDYPLVDGPVKAGPAGRQHAAKPRTAVTHYTTLARIELPIATGRYSSSRYSLLEAKPNTGRQHQLRRHFKHIFHPIIGDTCYGDARHNRLFREQFACHRLLLHAAQLEFLHPQDKRKMVVKATLDTVFQQLLERFGWPT